jgi:hypothetical protein
VSKGRKIALVSELVADGQRVAAAAHLRPATESEVTAEIMAELVARFCVSLSDFSEPVRIRAGELVSISTASRQSIKRAGIDTGMPDLWLARVGRWGWQGIEIKKRGVKGRCAGTISVAQDVAQLSKLTEIVWCAAHVRELIARLDREVSQRAVK